ncbi:MAG: hypothetical protein QNJ12_09500 [Ilumatobacter sp.]|uniref:hypothetical protein n=1 Tax=Ilumatobacter sp. TaxID=1967498 RepID=UPI002601D3EC|nr:hypothetical protein [Ilumatobacter sp.]MDJ0769018.1 hypothetical protein [Ilumatobacter sp.]
MRGRTLVGLTLGLSMIAAACGGDEPGAQAVVPAGSTTAELPFSEAEPDFVARAGDGEVADELAPSQETAETVPRPDTPGPCAAGDLHVWTAQVVLGERSADAVVRVRNAGDRWCEADLSASPQIDPAAEPDVWLEPGEWADLVIGPSGDDCDEPSLVTLATVDVNGTPVDIPTSALMRCGWQVTAFFPNETADSPCGANDLEVAVLEAHVLVRNADFRPCVLGELVSVTRAAVVPRGDAPAASALPVLTTLAGGDVVAFAYEAPGDAACTAPAAEYLLSFTTAGDVPFDGVACDSSFVGGSGTPYFGVRGAPFDVAPGEALDVDAALLALDPFGLRAAGGG